MKFIAVLFFAALAFAAPSYPADHSTAIEDDARLLPLSMDYFYKHIKGYELGSNDTAKLSQQIIGVADACYDKLLTTGNLTTANAKNLSEIFKETEDMTTLISKALIEKRQDISEAAACRDFERYLKEIYVHLHEFFDLAQRLWPVNRLPTAAQQYTPILEILTKVQTEFSKEKCKDAIIPTLT
ncbi:hypothetical protein RJ55_07664 [Drechmeria coniospora]|nr:hypothetical protein RJ55_07664 [Drechmeria coniospora]